MDKPLTPPADTAAAEGERYKRGLSIKAASERLGCSQKLIRRAIKEGKLPAFLPPGTNPRHPGSVGYKIQPADLVRWWTGQKP